MHCDNSCCSCWFCCCFCWWLWLMLLLLLQLLPLLLWYPIEASEIFCGGGCFATVKITFTCNIAIVVDDFYLKLIQDERGDAGKMNENSTTSIDLSHECMKAKSSPKVCKLTTSMYLHCQLCQVGWRKSAELPELCCHSNASLLSDSTWGAEVNNLLLAFEFVGGRTDDRMM